MESPIIQRQEVRYFTVEDSSAISKVSYACNDHTLMITFTNGKNVLHTDVPPGIFTNLLQAKSVGGFYNDAVRDVYDTVEQERKVFYIALDSEPTLKQIEKLRDMFAGCSMKLNGRSAYQES